MKIYLRILSIFSLCMLCNVGGYGDVEQIINTNVQVKSWTKMDHDKQCLQIYNSLTNKEEYEKQNKFCSGGSIKNGICKMVEQDNKQYARCVAISCKEGYYLKVRQEKNGTYSSNGVCGHDSDCNDQKAEDTTCKGGKCKLKLSKVALNEWSSGKISNYIKKHPELYDQDVVKLTNNNKSFQCELKFNLCTEQQLKNLKAETGESHTDVPNSTNQDDYYCLPTKCIDKYILQNNKCEPCQECVKPNETANCDLVSSDGKKQCEYTTSCREGYNPDSLTGANTPNPKCTPLDYSITYELNGGPGSCSPTSRTYGEGATIDCKPTRENYNFKGWCTDAELKDCSPTHTIDANYMGDKTFYAKWAEKGCEEKYSNEEQRACICTEQKPWKDGKCDCGDGYEWRDNKCSPLPPPPECPDETITAHQSAYDAAIALIKDEYRKKAEKILADCASTPGYIDENSLQCIEIEANK